MKLMLKLINIFMTDSNKFIIAVFISFYFESRKCYDLLNFIRDIPDYLY